MQHVVVLDYGMSNLRSVAKALEHVADGRARVQVSGAREDLIAADRVVFPGQGASGECMRHLRELDLIDTVRECAHTKPFLGICLGLQSLMTLSDEDGGTPGLDIYPGRVVRFQPDLREPSSGARLKIPHMGWNQVLPRRLHPLWADIEPGTRFYFVHSYYVVPEDPALIAGTTDYGENFCAALACGNVFAVQFHPEKSQRAGLALLRNFLAWDGSH